MCNVILFAIEVILSNITEDQICVKEVGAR